MTLPYGVISDPHYHRWDAFATTNADGLNSRLEIQLDATKEAAKAMKAAGCKHMLVAGDTFHVRGAISPSVLHFVTETYEWIIKELGLKVVMLAGNHDLETNDSVYSANAAASLHSIGVEIVCGKRPHSIKMGDVTVHLISWRNNHAELISDLKTLRSGLDGDNHDVVVHTSINKAIPTMPDVGIDAQELKDIGFRLLLSGHYHNHKEVLPGVVSIGALTHQNWGDVGSLAGFMIVKPDGSFTHHETSAPKFAAIREQARGVTTVMLIPQSLDTQWYERAAECANETVILSGGRVAFVEPDVELGLVEVNINPGGSMLLIFRGYCQEAGHTISKIPLAVMKKLGGYDPANVVRKKRPRKKAA